MKAEVRPYQQRVISKAVESLAEQLPMNKEFESILISSPPGSGKTYMGLSIAAEIIKRLGNPDLVVGWSAMRKTLLDQAIRENAEFGHIVKNIVPVSIFNSAPPKCDILVYDEAHHSVADSSINLLTNMNPKMYIGLSATPFRSDGMKLNFAETIVDANYRTLIHDGYLAKFDMYMMGDKYTAQTVADTYIKFREQWGKSIAFFLTTAECYECAELLKAAGVNVSVVTHMSDVDEELRKFRDGETDIMLNVYMLVEGFDCPELETVFCRPSSKAPTIQMIGRGLRKHGDKVARIVQTTDSHNPFSKFADPRITYTLDSGKWLTVNGDPENIRKVVKQTIDKIQKFKGERSVGLANIIALSGKKNTSYDALVQFRIAQQEKIKEAQVTGEGVEIIPITPTPMFAPKTKKVMTSKERMKLSRAKRVVENIMEEDRRKEQLNEETKAA